MIKSKYPQYEALDNLDLANRMLEKYPTYQDMIVKKKRLFGIAFSKPFYGFYARFRGGLYRFGLHTSHKS